MPRWLELHDSKLLTVTCNPQCVTVSLNGYIHEWERQSTGWRGTGWTQHILVRVLEPESTLQRAAVGPVEIADGTLECASGAHANVIPLPFAADGPILLQVELADGSVLEIAGASVSVEPEGVPTYVEDLPEDLRPNDGKDGTNV